MQPDRKIGNRTELDSGAMGSRGKGTCNGLPVTCPRSLDRTLGFLGRQTGVNFVNNSPALYKVKVLGLLYIIRTHIIGRNGKGKVQAGGIDQSPIRHAHFSKGPATADGP